MANDEREVHGIDAMNRKRNINRIIATIIFILGAPVFIVMVLVFMFGFAMYQGQG
ncbi:hypothetical protein [Eupransor demetentiae]|uniref:Uncharacterized protein n=1 Tax=Eupransor demetentiae TaxID=3109584 RepID=A0ABP0EU14_9LACO|nr:hypothetical protein R54876_GBNLAHCA_01509 [Lactobacillaceae bacterium LMG 33000]